MNYKECKLLDAVGIGCSRNTCPEGFGGICVGLTKLLQRANETKENISAPCGLIRSGSNPSEYNCPEEGKITVCEFFGRDDAEKYPYSALRDTIASSKENKDD